MKKTEEELLEELRELYDSGQIDNVFYDKETAILRSKIANRKRREKEAQKAIRFNKISKLAVPLILIISFAILFINMNDGKSFYFKEYEKIISYDRIPSPVQRQLDKPIKETVIVNGETYDVTLKYEYTIYGKVVDTLTYPGKTKQTEVVPKDVGLVWGPMAQDRFLKKMSFKSGYNLMGARFLKVEIVDGDGSEFRNMGFFSYISNNHILGADDRATALIHKIRKNQYVKLEGYLCEVSESYTNKVGGGTLIESDYERGNLDCETIYVTDVKWLKEK